MTGSRNDCSVRSASSDGAVLDVGRAPDEDGELVAAEARDDVAVADGAHQPRGDAAQQLVADRGARACR